MNVMKNCTITSPWSTSNFSCMCGGQSLASLGLPQTASVFPMAPTVGFSVLFCFFSNAVGASLSPWTKAAKSINTHGSCPQQWGGSWWIKSVASCFSGGGSGRPSCNFSGSPCEVESLLPSHLYNACLYWLIFLYAYPQPLAFASWYHVLEKKNRLATLILALLLGEPSPEGAYILGQCCPKEIQCEPHA